MSSQEKNDKDNALPSYFSELPPPHIKHPANFVDYFGGILSRYRRNLPREQKNQSAFGRTLGCYFGGAVDRNRIGRAEQGDITVSFGVYAAYINEMGSWPDILRILEDGDGTNLRYLMIIENELDLEICEAAKKCLDKLNGDEK